MIKLIKNELMKIFKRKTIYFLFFLSIIVIITYNNINPDQNPISSFSKNTNDVPIDGMQSILESINKNNIDEYVTQKSSIDFWKLYNQFKQDSWQRYALKEEATSNTIYNLYTDYNLDINNYLKIINSYENNINTEITIDLYENAKEKYNEYVSALNSNDWRKFVDLKIKNLEERKIGNLNDNEIKEIDFEEKLYKLRLSYDIEFNYDISNQYINTLKNYYYNAQLYKNYPHDESQSFINKNLNECIGIINLCKYAIENNLKTDISNENTLIYDNKIDARIAFIRTLKHFDFIVVIIAVYISTTILTEETNNRTIKNLLIKPHKRSTILLSKIIACIITLIITIIFIIITQYIVGGIIFGFNSYEIKYIGYDYNNDQIIVMNLFKFVLLTALLKLPMYIIIILFCIFMGVINNHTSMSMILTLIIFIIASTILKEWSKVESLNIITRYFVTNNWDFSIYMFGQISDISGITLYGSIINCLIYLLIMLFIIINKFKNKEIYNFK